MTIDLHGLRADDAEFELRRFIDAAPPGTHTVEVIHGNGTGALKAIAHEMYHPRIAGRALCLGNPGQTNLYLHTNY